MSGRSEARLDYFEERARAISVLFDFGSNYGEKDDFDAITQALRQGFLVARKRKQRQLTSRRLHTTSLPKLRIGKQRAKRP
jgi:hypothetical protein